MPQTYVNPFNPQTPVGASLQNIATAMFANNSNARALAEERHQHADLYKIMGEKHLREMAAADAMERARSPDAMEENVAWATGTPIAAIRNAGAYLRGNLPAGSMPPAGPVMRNIGDTMFSLRTGMADKTVNAHEIGKAIAERAALRNREDVMSGAADPTLVSQAHYATSGRAPFDNMGDKGTFNVLTGGNQSLNAIGTQAASAEQALGAARNALADQRNLETRSGVKIGPPVPVENDELGPRLTSPLLAGAPGNRPMRVEGAAAAALADSRRALAEARTNDIEGGYSHPLVPTVGADGRPVLSTREDAAGSAPAPMPRDFAPPRAAQPKPIDERRVLAEINRQLGITFDKANKPDGALPLSPQVQGAVAARAAKLAQQSGNISEAVNQAIYEMGDLQNERKPGTMFGTNATGFRVPVRPMAQAQAASPQGSPTSVGSLPPQAAAQLKEGVQTTFKNGQTWSMVDGKPVKIK